VGPSPAPGERSATLVSALREIGGFEESVLRQLTTAGLVTVDQLLAAKPDEIMVVSGLSAAVVDELLEALRRRAAGEREGENVIKLELRSDSLRQQLDAKHRTQVKAEASVIELRAEVQRLRSHIAELRDELAGLAARKDKLQAGIRQESDRIGTLTSALRQARTAQKNLAQRREEMEQELQRKEDRVLELRAECLSAAEEKERFDQEVRALVGRVERLLQNTHL
jgi:chromosome segregation ATPase